MAPANPPSRARSDRPFDLLAATAVVVSSMIGTGVFTTSGFALADLHSRAWVLVAWIAGGLVAALGALSYGALARRFPESGGEYLFLSRTLHPAAGYLAGWVSLFAGFSAPIAAAAMAFGAYSRPFWPDTDPRLPATVLLVAAALVHAIHPRRGIWVHNAAVALKLLILVLFVGIAAARVVSGASSVPLDQATPAGSGTMTWGAFAVSLVWISFAYSGWNAAVYVGGEVRDAERTLPRSLLLGTAIVTALYLLLNAIFLGSAPPSALAGKLEIGLVAAGALGGETLARALSGMISAVLVAHVSGMTLAGPRVLVQMAADGCLPRVLLPAGPAPRAAMTTQTALALVLLWTARFEELLTYIGFTLGLSTAAAVAGLVRLRLREGASLRVTGWPWVPLLFLAMTLWSTAFAATRRPRESLVGLAVLLAGLIAWRFSYRTARARPEA